MENNTAFFNLYLEKIINEVQELTKAKLLLQTQIAWNEKTIQEMTDFQNKLQDANNNLNTKLKAALDKKMKKSNSEKLEQVQEADTF